MAEHIRLINMKRLLPLSLLITLSLSAGATTFYVKNGGNDGADGLSDATAWATIAKVNSVSLSSADSVLFKRNNIWRTEVLDPDAGVYYGAYGSGNKPLFLGSIQQNNTSDWTDLGGNIWENDNALFTVDVGNIIFNNEQSCGVKIVSATPTLDAQGEFWYDYGNDLIRMYSVGNPALYYSNIECALSVNAIKKNYLDNITFQNLDFRYWGVHVTEDTGNYIKFYDLDISYIGGADQGSYSGRFGNGLQFWQGNHDITIERCRFDNIYDAAITPQGFAGTYEVYNMWFRNNIITNCEYSYEIWFLTGSTIHDIYFENNTCLYAGGGWGHDQRPDGHKGHHLNGTTYYSGNNSNLKVRNNIFYECTEAVYHAGQGTGLSGFDIDYNCVVTDGRIGEENPAIHVYETWSAWLATTTHDDHSITSDPLFSSINTLELNSLSPCIDAGIDVGISFTGTAPDIGAKEYGYIPILSGNGEFGKNRLGIQLKDKNGNLIKF